VPISRLSSKCHVAKHGQTLRKTKAARNTFAVADSMCTEVTSVAGESEEIIDLVLLSGIEFPASDPPSWLGTTAGAPVKLPTQHEQVQRRRGGSHSVLKRLDNASTGTVHLRACLHCTNG
jgi:hypothetical protein